MVFYGRIFPFLVVIDQNSFSLVENQKASCFSKRVNKSFIQAKSKENWLKFVVKMDDSKLIYDMDMVYLGAKNSWSKCQFRM